MLLLTLFACSGDPATATWMEGLGYSWVNFNHRVGYVGFELSEQQAHVAVIGGTSTTLVSEPLDAGCEEDSCEEFPFLDSSEFTLSWARVRTSEAAIGTATTTIVATSAGGTTTVDVPLVGKTGENTIVILSGLVIDTDYPLSGGDNCYRPQYGWLPRHLGVELGAPAITKGADTAAVPVTVVFEAGLTLEAERACLDAVVAEAQVPVTVSLVVVSGDGKHASQAVSHGETYGYGSQTSPEPQPDPDLSTRPLALGLADPVAGWSSFDFEFHGSDADGRGAYLRSLYVQAMLADGVASGHATNYSPPTQLSGFEYSFRGTVSGIEAGAAVERGTVTGTIEAALNDDGSPEVFSFDL